LRFGMIWLKFGISNIGIGILGLAIYCYWDILKFRSEPHRNFCLVSGRNGRAMENLFDLGDSFF